MRPRRAAHARDRRGIAGVETALAVGILFVPLCLGILSLGIALTTTNRLDCALQAAVFYAWANPGSPSGWGSAGSTSVSGALNAALTAYGNSPPSANIAVSVGFNCVSAGYLAAQPPVNYTCPTGQAVATYLTMTASTSVAPPGMPLAAFIPLSVVGTVRVQ